MANFIQRAFSVMRGWSDGSALMSMIGRTNDVSGRLNVTGMDKPAENLIWIYLGMTVRSQKISQVELIITDDQDNRVTGGDLYDLLRKPNSAMDGVQYIALIECYLALYDIAVVVKVLDGASRPTELIPVSPQNLTPIRATHLPTGISMVAGYEYADPHSGKTMKFTNDDLIVIRGHNPHNPMLSLSPLLAGMRTMKGDLAAREQNLAIFLNGGMPDVVFETEQKWTKEQGEEFLARWKDRYGGFSKAHQPGILYGGLKAKGIGLSPTELQFLEGLRMGREEQIALMRVTPAMVGIMTGETGLSQGSSTTEQGVMWWNSTGLYELRRIAAAHQESLVDPYAWSATKTDTLTRSEQIGLQRAKKDGARGRGLRVWHNVNEIPEMVEHRLAKIDTGAKLRAQGYLPDDINEFLGLNLPQHPTNVGTLPLAVQPVEDVGGAAPVIPDPKRTDRTDSPDLTIQRIDRIAELIRAEAAEPTPAKWRGIRKSLDARAARMEKQLAKKYARYFIEQRGRVLDAIGGTVSRAEEKKASQINLSDIFQKDTENALLAQRMAGAISEAIKSGWESLNEEIGAGANPFEIEDPRVQEALVNRRIQGAKINDTTEDELRKILGEAVAAGDSAAQLGDRIADYYNANAAGETTARPQTAARTQINGLVNDGRMAAANKVKGLKKAWLHGGSAEAREAHLSAAARYQAQPIPLNEKFEVNGIAMDAPGDASAPVGEVANCSCMVIFVPENS